MKLLWVIGSISLLLTVAYNMVGGASRAAVQSAEQSVTMTVAYIGAGDKLSPGFSEYLFLHRTRYEIAPVHPMADAKVCPE